MIDLRASPTVEALMALRLFPTMASRWRSPVRVHSLLVLLVALMVFVFAAASIVDARETTPASINQPTRPIAVDSDDHGVFRSKFTPTEPSMRPQSVAPEPSMLLTALPIDLRFQRTSTAVTSEPKAPSIVQTTRHSETQTLQPPSSPSPPKHQSAAASHAPTTSVVVHQTTAAEDALAFHKSVHKQLVAEANSITQQLIDTQAELRQIERLLKNERQFYEDAHAERVVQAALPSPRGANVRQLSCHGWKKTNNCRYTGARRPEMDSSCFTPVTGGSAGYCEVRDDATKESFKVMRVNCSSLSVKTTIWCQLAPQFANFPALIERAIADTPTTMPETTPGNAIVMVVLSSQIHHAQTSIRALRRLGCTLPVELWYFESEMSAHMDDLRTLVSSDRSIVWRPIHTLPYSAPAVKFAKIHAVAHSAFANVLYLDPAVLPLRDPTYLFYLPEFLSTGTVFWPDLFHPSTTESNIQPSSLLWELLDMPAVRMFEQDDRQLLVCRDTALVQASLRVLEMASMQRPNLFEKLELVKRGKDLFRLAWLKMSTPFHVVGAPPAIGGRYATEDGATERFCGTHIVQHDPSGRMLFVHRHSAGEEPTPSGVDAQITHVQVFDWRRDGKRLSDEDIMAHYHVQSFTLLSLTCFAHSSTSTGHKTTPWSEKLLTPSDQVQ